MGKFNSSIESARFLSEYNNELTIFLIPNTIILSLYLIIGVTGNVISIFVYGVKIKDVKGKRFFIPYLAAVDLLSIMIGGGFAVALNVLPVRFHGDILCKSLWFLCAVFAIQSCLILLVISVQRYIEVCKPHNQQMTRFWKKVALLLTVILAFGTSTPNILFHGEIEVVTSRNITGHRCGILKSTSDTVTFFVYNCILFALNAAGVVVMVIIYSLIGRDIFRLMKRQERRKSSTHLARISINRNTQENTSIIRNSLNISSQRKSLDMSLDSLDILNSNADRTSNTSIEGTPRSRSSSIITEYAIRGSIKVKVHFQRHRHSWMCMMISLMYVIAFTPRISLMFIESLYPTFWDNLDNYQIRLCLFFYRLYIINHVINPFIFGFFDKLFREECRKLFCECRKRVPSTDL